MSWDLFGWTVSAQIAFNGLVLGLGYAVVAAGIVLVYRSSGIVNFAQAAMGAFGVASFVVLFQNYDLPYPLAMVIGVASAALLGVTTELVVVRRLFNASRVVLLIATVGVAQLIAFLIIEALPDVQGGAIPVAFDAAWAQLDVADGFIIGARQTSVLLLVAPALLALALLLTRTRLGLHIRAVADSPENARLIGVSPKRVSTIVWALAAGFAAFTQIAVAPIVTRTADDLAGVSTIGLLLRALLVALAARMRSIPLVVAASLGLGLAESVIAVNLNRNVGVFNAFLLVGVLVLILFRARGTGARDNGFTIGVRRAPLADDLARRPWIRRLPAGGMLLLLAGAVLVPALASKPSQLLVWTELLLVAMMAISLSLLTGWAGQLSLGQFAFAGVGGLSMLAFTRGQPLGIGLPWIGHLTAITIDLPWGAALVAATATGVGFAVLVGLPALRVGGLFLAVTTLAFANFASGWMFNREFWSGGRPQIASAVRERPSVFGLELADPARYYYLCLAVLVVIVVVVSRLRRSGSGRTMIAVRDNEPMTAAATVSPTRAKLSAFAVSGGIAALAGALYAFLLPGFFVTGPESPFAPGESLQLVAVAIIGGIGSVAGAIIGALWVVGLPAAFGGNDTVRLLTANIGLLVLLLYFPGGLVQVIYNLRDVCLARLSSSPPGGAPDRPRPQRVVVGERRSRVPADGVAWLTTENVSVTFGGINAVQGVSIEVHRGEIVGLIGTNGAGKSTLMNAVSGFNSHTGHITVLGRDVTGFPSHQRHAVGLGRGFQDARLYGGLTVRETILVALEARERSGLLTSLTGLPPSPSRERHKRAEADEILDFLGLGRYADRFSTDLSTGMRRIVELACLVATDARVLLLDEPTGGVAQREIEAFGPLIRRIQQDLDAALLVIEHDMPLIMSISDRVYCMEAGQVIAAGSPADVRNDPLVISSYLGTNERAIARSDQPPSLLVASEAVATQVP